MKIAVCQIFNIPYAIPFLFFRCRLKKRFGKIKLIAFSKQLKRIPFIMNILKKFHCRPIIL